ncbi:hypothetical protein QUF76_17585, partial [Desulfobacterales bacterium HSG16]|nr:hypothetical protein [Desulfobacterales bacterium HSG16]
WNSLIFHFTQYAPAWGAPFGTAYLILIGLNIEISFMFLIMGVASAQLLPEDKTLKILGIPNRLFYAVLNSIMAVGIECVLNAIGALTWEYSWWNMKAPWLIFLVGYLPFFVVSYWVYDMESVKKKAITVGTIFSFDGICLIVFGPILGWI